MQLITFTQGSKTRIGVLSPQTGEIQDVLAVDAALPDCMQDLIEAGESGLTGIRAALKNAPLLDVAAVQLNAPIPTPRRNIFCIGKNYHDHIQEIQHALGGTRLDDNADAPPAPIFFTKATTTVSASGDAILASDDSSDSTDYEGELAVIIGKRGKKIPAADAFEYVYGYSILNDVTARRLQKKHQQWFLGKSLDGYCPMGPALVTADEIADVSALTLKTTVNNEERQSGSLSDLIFDIPTIIEVLSSCITLVPGDIIATGTPAGVGMGFEPPRFLKPGDTVTIEISGLGVLSNPVC